MAGNANESFQGLCAVCVTLLHESLEGMSTHAVTQAVNAGRDTALPSIHVNGKQVRVS